MISPNRDEHKRYLSCHHPEGWWTPGWVDMLFLGCMKLRIRGVGSQASHEKCDKFMAGQPTPPNVSFPKWGFKKALFLGEGYVGEGWLPVMILSKNALHLGDNSWISIPKYAKSASTVRSIFLLKQGKHHHHQTSKQPKDHRLTQKAVKKKQTRNMMQYINLHTLGNLRLQNRKHQGGVPLWEPAEHLHQTCRQLSILAP